MLAALSATVYCRCRTESGTASVTTFQTPDRVAILVSVYPHVGKPTSGKMSLVSPAVRGKIGLERR
jgi:hypothetical protein